MCTFHYLWGKAFEVFTSYDLTGCYLLQNNRQKNRQTEEREVTEVLGSWVIPVKS